MDWLQTTARPFRRNSSTWQKVPLWHWNPCRWQACWRIWHNMTKPSSRFLEPWKDYKEKWKFAAGKESSRSRWRPVAKWGELDSEEITPPSSTWSIKSTSIPLHNTTHIRSCWRSSTNIKLFDGNRQQQGPSTQTKPVLHVSTGFHIFKKNTWKNNISD